MKRAQHTALKKGKAAGTAKDILQSLGAAAAGLPSVRPVLCM